MSDKEIHFGWFIRGEREKRGYSREAFVPKIEVFDSKGRQKGLTATRLYQIEKLRDSGGIMRTTLGGIAAALGMTVDELDTKWRSTPASRPKVKSSNGVHRDPDLPAGIDQTILDAEPIPTWDIDVAASAWIDVPPCRLDDDDPQQRRVIATGRFRLKILGHCMEPHYSSGMTVEFQILRIDEEGMVVGRDYVVCRSDGMSTFKRLVSMDEDQITLAATNQKDFPGTISVPRQEICRVAKVVGRMLPPPDDEPVKVRRNQ